MLIEFVDFQKKHTQELKQMLFSLYQEDLEALEMNEIKISHIVETLIHKPEKGKIIIFKNNDEIVGYSILVFCWNTEYGGELVIIDDLYVKPLWRNQRISTKFFDYLIENYSHKAAALKLEVSPSNKHAREFYCRRGFMSSKSIHMIKEF